MKQKTLYPLDKLVFDLVPEGIPLPDILEGETIDETTANDIYRQAYRMVYSTWPKTEIGKNWQAAVSNSRQAEMDFKTFCLYIIAGFRVTHSHTLFYPANLTAKSSYSKVDLYRKACLQKFGVSDARSLGMLLNIELFDIDAEMLLSEISFGRYIMGYASTGTPVECAAVYDRDEIAFSPYWLAIEHTYHTHVFRPYLAKSKDITHWEKNELWSPAQLRHRHLVSQVISVLQRRKRLMSTIFSSRTRIMPQAAKSVFSYHRLTSKSPVFNSLNVDDAFDFWTQAGNAIKKEGSL